MRTVEIVGVFGKGFHTVKNPGGGLDYVVGDQTGGRTFAPGSQVLAGSVTGLPGEAILGGPPPGKKGSSRAGGRFRRPGRRVTPPPSGNQYAFYDSGSVAYAWIYQDATWVSDRGTIASPGGQAYGVILSDEAGAVGVGSLLLDDEPTFRVWDVVGSTTYSRTAPAGWAMRRPVHYGAYLWWPEIEIPDGSSPTVQCRLVKSDCDFTNATVVGTWTSGTLTSNIDDTLLSVWGLALGAAHVWFRYSCSAPLEHAYIEVRLPTDGSAATERASTSDEIEYANPPVYGVCQPPADGSLILTVGLPNVASGIVFRKPDDVTTAPASYWPLAFWGEDETFGASNLNAVGNTLQVCGQLSADTVLRAGIATAPTELAASFTPTNHPSVGQPPEVMFYFD